MSKWYDAIDCSQSNIMYSRIRLARNWDEYVFPSRLTRGQCEELVTSLKDGLADIGSLVGREYHFLRLDSLQGLEKQALRERRILNQAAVERQEPSGLYLSDDEAESLVLGGDDHIRMQHLAPGLKLEELWQRADAMDDYVNERFSYAYPDKTIDFHFFNAHIAKGSPEIRVHSEIKWVSPRELIPEDFCPADVTMVRQLRDQN